MNAFTEYSCYYASSSNWLNSPTLFKKRTDLDFLPQFHSFSDNAEYISNQRRNWFFPIKQDHQRMGVEQENNNHTDAPFGFFSFEWLIYMAGFR